MSFDNRTYLNEVSWRTYFSNTVLNTEETESEPATWDTTIYPIDANENGANPMVLTTECYAISNGGTIYEVSAINVGSNQYRITLKDIFFRGLAPEADLIGIVYKSAYKNYAFAIAPVWLNYLDKMAGDYVNSLEKSILWRNDPNPLIIPFTATKTPTISNYQSDQVIEGRTVNLAEDYGENPQLMMIIEQTVIQEQYYEKPPKRILVDGLLNQIIFTLPLAQTGRIIISK